MDRETNFVELLDERQHKMGYYGFKVEKKYGKQGFCDSCHKNFILRIAFDDKFISSDKTVWIGACPHCGATIRMVDKMVPKVIMGTHPGHEAETVTGRDRTVTMSAFKWALSAILALRKYYKNQVRCTFLVDTGNALEDTKSTKMYEYEREYYEYATNNMIRMIKGMPLLEECWWMTVEEITEYIQDSKEMRQEFVMDVKELINAIKTYEETNWDRFFGPEACMHMKEEGFQPHVEDFKAMSEWTKTNSTMLTAFKTKRMPTEYETDDVLADAAIEKELDFMDETGHVMDENEEFDKSIDELEYGVDEIPDV